MGKKRLIEFGYVPIMYQEGMKPILHKRFIRTRRSTMIRDAVAEFYSGAHDWKYCRRMGWRAVKIKITAEPQP